MNVLNTLNLSNSNATFLLPKISIPILIGFEWNLNVPKIQVKFLNPI